MSASDDRSRNGHHRLELAFEACREITRRQAGNFYHGLKLTPEPKRSALYAIYAWMRAADDIVDAHDSELARRSRLDEFTARTAAVFDNAPTDSPDPMWLAFGATIKRFGLVAEEFFDLLEGMREDLDHDADAPPDNPQPRYRSREDLARYCYLVASTVGIVCMRVWGTRDDAMWDEARSLAIIRGRAFQLTNILRDYAGDYDDARVYLAAQDLDAAGLTPRALRDWADHDRCAAMITDIAAWARRCYNESRPLDQLIALDGAPAMWAMTRIYSTLLHTIERNPALVAGDTRAQLPTYRKVAIGVRALVRSVKS